MSDSEWNGDGESGMTRRSTLAVIGAGAATVVGFGGITGSALAWDRRDVEFKGCSEVWAIVAPDDLQYGNDDPSVAPYPTVAHVIVATGEGDLDCRVLEFTPETATTVPGQYGDAPVVKYAPPSGEKVLGLILYNYSSGEDRFSRESPLYINHHRCANTPGTPDPRDAPCADNIYTWDQGNEDEFPGQQRNSGKPASPGNSGQSGKPEKGGKPASPGKSGKSNSDNRNGNGRGVGRGR